MAFERDTPDGRKASTENQSDIVERLRGWHYSSKTDLWRLIEEAADAIESLRSDCSELEILADARCVEKNVVEDDLRAAEARIAELETSLRPQGGEE